MIIVPLVAGIAIGGVGGAYGALKYAKAKAAALALTQKAKVTVTKDVEAVQTAAQTELTDIAKKL